MKITKVTVRDFLTISTADFELGDQGLVAVAGVNSVDTSASSNGAGKSSLGDAVCFGIWGTTARNESGDDVIRTGAKKALIELTVIDEANGEIFNIARSRSKGKGITQVHKVTPSGNVDLTGGTEKLTQEVIRKIMGCSEEVFRSAVYLAQDNLPNLPMLTDTKLKEIVEEAAGVEVLNAAYAVASKQATDAKLTCDRLDMVVENTRRASEGAGIKLADTLNYSEEWAKDRTGRIAEHTSQIERQKVVLAERTQELAALPDIGKLVAVQSALQAKLDGLQSERDKHAELASAVAAAQTAFAFANRQVERAGRAFVEARAGVTSVESKIGTACSECGTVITADKLDHAKLHAQKSADNARTEAATAIQAKADADMVLNTARAALAAHTPADESSIHDSLNQVRDALRAHNDAKINIEAARKRMTELEATLAVTIAEVSPWEKRIEAAQTDCENVAAELAKARQEALEALDDRNVALEVASVFGPAGVRAHILDQVTPFLNQRTAEYLTTLTDGKISAVWTTLVRKADGTLREKFSIEVTHADHGKGFKAISGGEKRRVRLACAFALQDLVATRATKPIHLMITDEVDDALDTPGLERLMAVMTQKAKERGTVMVISHNDLKSWIGNCWTVTKTSDGSTLTYA